MTAQASEASSVAVPCFVHAKRRLMGLVFVQVMARGGDAICPLGALRTAACWMCGLSPNAPQAGLRAAEKLGELGQSSGSGPSFLHSFVSCRNILPVACQREG